MDIQFFSRFKREHAVWLVYSTVGASLALLLCAPVVAAYLGVEDNLVESVTALLFLFVSAIALRNAATFAFGEKRDVRYVGLFFAMAVLFFVFAGEEVSWGQRLFGFETNEFLQAYNWQGEMNLHNLQTDFSNIAYHYGALLFLIVIPLFSRQIKRLLDTIHLPILKSFIGPAWLAIPMLSFIGMLDPRFIYAVEKPWAATLYLFALFIGLLLLGNQLYDATHKKDSKRVRLLLLSLVLIAAGLIVSYFQAIDYVPNSISEYKELVVALGLVIYILWWKKP